MRWPLATILLSVALTLTACSDKQAEKVQRLKHRGYDFVVSEFFRAAAEGHAAAINEFLAAGMSVDVTDKAGRTAFFLATESGMSDVQQVLLKAGANPNQRIANGQTALMKLVAASREDPPLLEALLRAGADVGAADAQGLTAPMVAAAAGQLEILRRLLPRHFASLDRCFLFAATQGHTHCLDYLAEQGAYLNATTASGQTALMLAASRNYPEAVSLLLRLGADRELVDTAGHSAARLAATPALAQVILSWDEGTKLKEPPNVTGPRSDSTGKHFRLGHYHERKLPFVLVDVGPKTARLRLGLVEMELAEGENIGGSLYALRRIHPPGKDSSPVFVEVESEGGRVVRLEPGQSALDPELTRLGLLWDGQDSFVSMRPGDEFQKEGGEGSYRVLEISPHLMKIADPKGITLEIARQPPN